MNKFARMMKRKVFLAFLCVLFVLGATAQDRSKMYSYDFKGALAEYRDSLKSCTDSLRREAFLLAAQNAENGIALTGFSLEPVVVERKRFHKDDFYLYYPLPDGGWHRTRDGSKIIFNLSIAADTVRLARRDSLELFPMICGKDRYFASRDLYGMGGYDLYVSHWDDAAGDWGRPENLGFPYSSPFDDFLFMNTEDGRYSIFASNRDCPPDSVNVYVLDYEANPVHRAVSEPRRLKEIAALAPPAREIEKKPVRKAEEEGPASRYSGLIREVRSYKDSVSSAAKVLDRLREDYARATVLEKSRLADAILDGEVRLTSLRASLDRASKELRDIETDFLVNGVELNLSGLNGEEEKPVEETPRRRFVFNKRIPGLPVNVIYR